MLNPQLYRLTHNYWIIEQKMRMKFLRFSADLQGRKKSDNRFCSFVAFCRNEATYWTRICFCKTLVPNN